jgi:hypothetical protein
VPVAPAISGATFKEVVNELIASATVTQRARILDTSLVPVGQGMIIFSTSFDKKILSYLILDAFSKHPSPL